MGGPADWAKLSLETIEALIRPKGCHVLAAKAIVDVCTRWANEDLERMAHAGSGLQSKVMGLGEKTASCVYLYYGKLDTHFVIDSNCLRFLVDCGLQPTPREQTARGDWSYPNPGGLKNPTTECRRAADEMKGAFGPAGLQLPFEKVFKLSVAMNVYTQLFANHRYPGASRQH